MREKTKRIWKKKISKVAFYSLVANEKLKTAAGKNEAVHFLSPCYYLFPYKLLVPYYKI